MDLHCKPGSPFEDDDRALARAAIEMHVASGRYVLAVQDGQIVGFMTWIRTNEFGAAMIQELEMNGLIYLAIPIPFSGPGAVITYTAIADNAPRHTIFRLSEAARMKNKDAAWAATFIRHMKGCKWIKRTLNTPG